MNLEQSISNIVSICNEKDKEIEILKKEIKELNDKYTKLLIFGISLKNEKLKDL